MRSVTRLSILVLSLTAPAGAAVHQMFVTSAIGSAKLSTWAAAGGQSGVAAGDTICQNLASAAGLANPANFVAWISTSTTDAFCHVAGFGGTRAANCGQATLPNAGPWLRTDGKAFSRALQAMTANHAILYPGELDENGDPVVGFVVMTGTTDQGTVDLDGFNVPKTCADWTSDAPGSSPIVTVGFATAGTFWWTEGEGQQCPSTRHLYCFERGSGDPLGSISQPGAFVFVTSAEGTGDLGSWAQAGGQTGLAAGDAICQNLASAAGLPVPASYVAWLSTAAVDAIDRLPGAVAFRRPGGVEIAATKAGLLAPTPDDFALESDIEADETGVHWLGPVFTGTTSLGVASGTDCDGWTSALPAETGRQGQRVLAIGQWTDAADVSCGSPHSIYCFSTVIAIFADDFESADTTAWSVTVP